MHEKTRKFLPFTGRLAFRKNGLIDITSPDDELSGFRVTLRPGTDSYTVAVEAMEEHGLLPALERKDMYESDLPNQIDLDGLLLGLQDNGEYLVTDLPAPGGAVWIVNSSPEGGIFRSIAYERIFGLRSKALHAYTAKFGPVTMSNPPFFVNSRNAENDSFEEAAASWEKLITHATLADRSRNFIALYLDDVSNAVAGTYSGFRKELGKASVMPIMSTHKDLGIQIEDLVIYTGGRLSPHSAQYDEATLPSTRNWRSEVPLSHAFAKLPGQTNFIRFRMV